MRFNDSFQKGCVAAFAAILMGGTALEMTSCASHTEPQTVSSPEDTVKVEAEKVYPYNIPSENYDVDYQEVKSGQNLSYILSHYGLSAQQIHDLNLAAEGIFDVRKMRCRQPYAMYISKDSTATPHYMVYEENEVDYVVFDLRPQGKVWTGQKPVEWRQQQVKGQVESSLWVAMEKSGAAPQLALKLANVFGWTVDFFGLQKEDEFRVLYEQEYVEDTGLDNFRILAASFKASDSLYYAIPFVQKGEEMFYNLEGKSLEGAFLKAPLDFYRITSKFSNARFHPVLKRYRAHHGVDYAAPVGTPVYAVGSGKVVAMAYQANGAGRYLKIKHNGTYLTSYMHLSRFAKGLKVGDMVKQKEVIGYVGSTGLSTGPHLDFRIFENGRPINPLTVKSQPKQPISPENMTSFVEVRDSLVKVLKTL